VIWLVGANGMLGRELTEFLTRHEIPFLGTGREVDIADLSSLERFAAGWSFEWIVNGAAYTAVDQAEAEPAACRAVNALGPQNLGALASRLGARVLHVSTDYVFDGEANRPYREDDPVNPLTVYGRTKAEGEQLLLDACPTSIILRTAWLYGLHGSNFVATMLRLMKEKASIGVVADQWGAPTWTADLAMVILAILENPPLGGGLYHASGEGQTSWHGFAEAIAEQARLLGLLDPQKSLEIRPLSTAEYPTKAKRPRWSVLSKTKLQDELGLGFPPWQESLHNYLQILSKNSSEKGHH